MVFITLAFNYDVNIHSNVYASQALSLLFFLTLATHQRKAALLESMEYFPTKGTVIPYPDGTEFVMPKGRKAKILRECPCTDQRVHYEVMIEGYGVMIQGHGDVTECLARVSP